MPTALPIVTASRPTPTRVLVAEDDEKSRLALTFLFRRYDFEVIVAPDGQDALDVLDHIRQHRHDLLRLRFHPRHPPQRMEKVGLPRLVHGSFAREDDPLSSALGASGSCLT